MIEIALVTRLHADCTHRWHEQAVGNPYSGWLGLVCHEHGFNFQLWHEEDKARAAAASDAEIGQVKRAIDRLNQQRNDAIERLDDWIASELAQRGISPGLGVPQNTETLGSAIDRLSILALRAYHLREQYERDDVPPEQRQRAASKLTTALAQRDELALAAQQLATDLAAGRKRHKAFRQLKMYNDPAFNSYLQATPAELRRAG
jgi:hypothetical protein